MGVGISAKVVDEFPTNLDNGKFRRNKGPVAYFLGLFVVLPKLINRLHYYFKKPSKHQIEL